MLFDHKTPTFQSQFSSSSESSDCGLPLPHQNQNQDQNEDQGQDLGTYENNIENSDLTLHETSTYINTQSSDPAFTQEHKDEKNQEPLQLSEYEVICRTRSHPDDNTPVVLCFGPHDLDNPRNWGRARKWYITCFVSLLNVLTCLCAGGYSSTVPLLKQEYHISSTRGTLGLSTYILGFAFGPLLLAPLSEHWGRNPIYIISWALLVVLQIPVALASNMTTIIGVRFLQGFVGSAPLTNSGGTIADLWERDHCGSPMAIYGLSSTLGPPLALPLTGYLAEREGWRVVFWVFMAVLGAAWILMIATLPETRHTIILKTKTHRLRTQLRAFHPRSTITLQKPPMTTLTHLFRVTLTRPLRFLLTEPITTSAALYNGLIYGLVFLFNESFPLVFGSQHHFTPAQTSLTFLGLCIGSIVASFFHPLQERHYLTKRTPESRMWLSLPACFLLPISLFWFAACSKSDDSARTHWIVPIIASSFFGAGIFTVALGVLNFVVDSYGAYAASSLAGVILVRNVVGAVFPLFAESMYKRVGFLGAGCLLGGLALVFCAVPFLFYYKGEEVRHRSHFAKRNMAGERME